MKKVFLFLTLLCATELFAVDISVARSAKEIGTEKGWKNGQAYESFTLNDRVTIAATRPTSGKGNGYYWNDKEPVCWRMYQARANGEFSISVPSGYTIRTVALEYFATKSGVLSLIPGQSVPLDSQVVSGQILSVNASSITLYAGNLKDSTIGQVSISKFTICYTFTDTTSVMESFSQVQQTQNNDKETTWEGDIDQWKALRVRRAAKDTLNNGVQATWINRNGYLQSTALDGGIKHVRFAWRQFVNGVAPIDLAVAVGNQWKDTLRTISTGSQPTSKNIDYDQDVFCQENAQIKFMNISSADTIRLLLGDIFITPYIYFPKEYRTISLQTTDEQYDLSQVLLDNTEGEGEIVYTIVSDATGGASITGSTVNLTSITRSGDVVIRASWNNGKVTATTTLEVAYVQDGQAWVESFADCPRRQYKNTSYVIGDSEIYDWNISNYSHLAADTILGAQGLQIRPGGSIASNGAQEGGVRIISFNWRPVTAGLPVQITLTVNGKSYSYTYYASAISDNMFFRRGVSTSKNVDFSIEVPSGSTYSGIVMGPVSVQPHILFTPPCRRDTIRLPETLYDLSAVLINNTLGVGNIVYSILSDETGKASLSGNMVDVSNVTQNGTVELQAQWGNVTTTMSLYVQATTTGLQNPFTDSPANRFSKILRNGQLIILRDNQAYNAQGSRL